MDFHREEVPDDWYKVCVYVSCHLLESIFIAMGEESLLPIPHSRPAVCISIAHTCARVSTVENSPMGVTV